MTLYRVCGIFKIRDHLPGETFFATLKPDEEARLVERGNIEVLERLPLTIDPARIRKPKG